MSAGNGDSKKTVCLAMPCYGAMSAGAAIGLLSASNGKHLDARLNIEQSSLLAQNMNLLWVWALNTARKTRVDYFAMLHADIEPEKHWLDKLITEMEAKNLDVLGVVAPIKDQRGVTSTALARLDGDPWKAHARLTMKEVYRLPETFTSEDVGYPLLINTGCWVCRFNEAWARQVHFTVNDRICFDPKKNIYFVQTEPEDWFISRLFHEIGLRIGCTRKVELGHRGPMLFGNTTTWGQNDFDKEYLTASALDGRWAADWFPEDVDGWLSEREGRELARLAKGKDVLEIGAYCGRSTICLAQRAESVITLDPFDGRGTPEPGPTLERFLSNLERYGVKDRVSYLVGTTAELSFEAEKCFDLVFIDGAHDYESVRADIGLACRVLRPEGLLAFHDYRLHAGECDGRWDEGVTQAVNELIASGAELLARYDSLAILRPAVADKLVTVHGD